MGTKVEILESGSRVGTIDLDPSALETLDTLETFKNLDEVQIC